MKTELIKCLKQILLKGAIITLIAALQPVHPKSNTLDGIINAFNGISSQPTFPFLSAEPAGLLNTTEANRNIARYWNYRNRLRTHFISLKTNDGGCLPIEEIIESSLIVHPSDHAKSGQRLRFAHWADSTVKLGWYIGVLATEIHMLLSVNKFPGFGYPEDTRNATIELYCALIALERLDQLGETKMWRSHPAKAFNYPLSEWIEIWPSTPGFFIRDDADVQTYTDLGLDGGYSDNFIGMNHFQLGHFKVPTDTFSYKTKQMSQDQVVHLLIGLALVKKFVPEEVIYQNVPLRRFAIKQADNMIRFVQGGNHKPNVARDWPDLGDLLGVARNDFVIRDPVSPRVSHFPEGGDFTIPYFDIVKTLKEQKYDPVLRGPSAFAYAEGFGSAGRFVTGKHYYVPPVYQAFWYTSLPPLIYGGGVTLEALNQLADAFNKDGLSDNLRSDNLHMLMALLAIGNDWEAGGGGTGLPFGGTLKALYILAQFEDFHIYPLLNRVLHPSAVSDANPLNLGAKATIRKMLREAPFGGPQAPIIPGAHGWGSDNRFIKSKLAQGGGANEYNNLVYQYFHGLDYMLLNNLFYIMYQSEWDGVFQDPRMHQTPLPDLNVSQSNSTTNAACTAACEDVRKAAIALCEKHHDPTPCGSVDCTNSTTALRNACMNSISECGVASNCSQAASTWQTVYCPAHPNPVYQNLCATNTPTCPSGSDCTYTRLTAVAICEFTFDPTPCGGSPSCEDAIKAQMNKCIDAIPVCPSDDCTGSGGTSPPDPGPAPSPPPTNHIVNRGKLPDLPAANWALSVFGMPPIGYAVPGKPEVLNACTANAAVQIPITVEYDDFYGNRDTVAILPIQGQQGFVTLSGAKNKFDYHGLFWGRWEWKDSIGFTLLDEDGNTFPVTLPLTYPGAVINAPTMGHAFKGWKLKVTRYWRLWGYRVPVAGYVDVDFTIYAQDKNCVPWKIAPWWVSDAESVVPAKLDDNTLRARIHWTIFSLNGSGKVVLSSVSNAGGPIIQYEIPYQW